MRTNILTVEVTTKTNIPLNLNEIKSAIEALRSDASVSVRIQWGK